MSKRYLPLIVGVSLELVATAVVNLMKSAHVWGHHAPGAGWVFMLVMGVFFAGWALTWAVLD